MDFSNDIDIYVALGCLAGFTFLVLFALKYEVSKQTTRMVTSYYVNRYDAYEIYGVMSIHKLMMWSYSQICLGIRYERTQSSFPFLLLLRDKVQHLLQL